MKLLKQRPTSGQFVAIWWYDGNLWCDTFKWIGTQLYRYVQYEDKVTEEEIDEFQPVPNHSPMAHTSENAIYFAP